MLPSFRLLLTASVGLLLALAASAAVMSHRAQGMLFGGTARERLPHIAWDERMFANPKETRTSRREELRKVLALQLGPAGANAGERVEPDSASPPPAQAALAVAAEPEVLAEPSPPARDVAAGMAEAGQPSDAPAPIPEAPAIAGAALCSEALCESEQGPPQAAVAEPGPAIAVAESEAAVVAEAASAVPLGPEPATEEFAQATETEEPEPAVTASLPVTEPAAPTTEAAADVAFERITLAPQAEAEELAPRALQTAAPQPPFPRSRPARSARPSPGLRAAASEIRKAVQARRTKAAHAKRVAAIRAARARAQAKAKAAAARATAQANPLLQLFGASR